RLHMPLAHEPARCHVVVPRGPVTLPLRLHDRSQACASATIAMLSSAAQAAAAIAVCIGPSPFEPVPSREVDLSRRVLRGIVGAETVVGVCPRACNAL